MAALKAAGVDTATAEKTAEALDVNKDGLCEYLEFCAAASLEEMASLLEELQPISRKHGLTLPDLDLNGDGMISLSEFCAYFGPVRKQHDLATSRLMDWDCTENEPGVEQTASSDSLKPFWQNVPAHEPPSSAGQPAHDKLGYEHKAESTATAKFKNNLSITQALPHLGNQQGFHDWAQWPFGPFLCKQSKVFDDNKAQMTRATIISL
eukprot:CAMPEP_0170652608 /NCGR_PEP_ID=MMETSP0224-20130122/46988_1 /TAXON_ID=285029 /ORGANISM="Togula jolla, Strain CCCM 725" /LENGTH=207 /DNA_ID=CAMNT_0010984471 /DNA_START=24 /DNA_END=648 /DNA_ORIENTATION=-